MYTSYRIQFKKLLKQKFLDCKACNVKLDKKVIKNEISLLLDKSAIINCKRSKGQFISPFFTVPKPDGSHRFIINRKRLNRYCYGSTVAGDVVRWAASSSLAHRRSSVELLPQCKVHRLYLLRGQGPRASGSSSLSVAARCPVDGRATATARP